MFSQLKILVLMQVQQTETTPLEVALAEVRNIVRHLEHHSKKIQKVLAFLHRLASKRHLFDRLQGLGLQRGAVGVDAEEDDLVCQRGNVCQGQHLPLEAAEALGLPGPCEVSELPRLFSQQERLGDGIHLLRVIYQGVCDNHLGEKHLWVNVVVPRQLVEAIEIEAGHDARYFVRGPGWIVLWDHKPQTCSALCHWQEVPKPHLTVEPALVAHGALFALDHLDQQRLL
mmetsp:Transcript_49162/g.130147  ORF Transcript_49162/g.130147 Transcript_49162/m.130147 type:complete len:228 (-) Transcript_49162:2073-2756(-)